MFVTNKTIAFFEFFVLIKKNKIAIKIIIVDLTIVVIVIGKSGRLYPEAFSD